MDYPLGLRSQGPAFKSPSGRFRDATPRAQRAVSVPKTSTGDLSRRVAAREVNEVSDPERLGAFKSPSGRFLRSRPDEGHDRCARLTRRPDVHSVHDRTCPTPAAARVGRRPNFSGRNVASAASGRRRRSSTGRSSGRAVTRYGRAKEAHTRVVPARSNHRPNAHFVPAPTNPTLATAHIEHRPDVLPTAHRSATARFRGY